MGKFDHNRWSLIYKDWFANFSITRNNRRTQKITIQGDGAFAIVDIDTLWIKSNGESSHWQGRTGKTYVKTTAGWKMIN